MLSTLMGAVWASSAVLGISGCGVGLRDRLKLDIGLYSYFSGAGSFERGRSGLLLGAVCITVSAVVVVVVWVLKSVVTLVTSLCFISQVACSTVLPRHSAHHPPHKQLLVRLEAGGVGVGVPRHLHP
jgi:hypothetical protein